ERGDGSWLSIGAGGCGQDKPKRCTPRCPPAYAIRSRSGLADETAPRVRYKPIDSPPTKTPKTPKKLSPSFSTPGRLGTAGRTSWRSIPCCKVGPGQRQ